MRTISTLICLLVLTGCLLADHKARGRSAWAWAVTCSNSPNKLESSTVKIEKPQQPQSATIQQSSVTYAESCSSGSCSQSVQSYAPRGLFRRR